MLFEDRSPPLIEEEEKEGSVHAKEPSTSQYDNREEVEEGAQESEGDPVQRYYRELDRQIADLRGRLEQLRRANSIP